MKRSFLLLLLVSSLAFAAGDLPVWQTNYNKGLLLMGQGNYQEGLEYLRMAAADKPISEVLTAGDQKLEYLPYLQMGICYFQMGKPRLAAEFFDLEDALPAIRESAGGAKLLKDYRSRTASRGSTGNGEAEQAIRDYKRKGYLLPDSEVARMKEEIRERCRLPKADERTFPWYYHYELGLALKDKNDWQRALDSFISALDTRDRPQKFSRIYGMWFIDYYPYYYIGKAHANLGNWKCADSSFLLSQMMEDIPKESKEFRDLQELKEEAKEHLAEESH